MALNLTPEYFEADRKYRQAKTPAEQLAALEEMLRAIPKHKASEKKQADLKRRISELRHSEAHPRKKGAAADPYHIPHQGAGQALLFGPPNTGKSSILGRLSNAPVKITDFPFGTPVPVPGMAYHEDVPIELVDLPPVTPDHVPGGMINAIRSADVLLIVADLGAQTLLEDLESTFDILAERDITFDDPEADGEEQGAAMRVGPHTLVLCNKIDLHDGPETFETLRELRPGPPEMLPVSAHTGQGLDDLMRRIFDMLDVVRIYTKEPGKPVDKDKPFLLPAGSTVEELARHIHKEMAEHLKFARVWGDQTHSGQQVHGHYVLHDRDTVELHVS